MTTINDREHCKTLIEGVTDAIAAYKKTPPVRTPWDSVANTQHRNFDYRVYEMERQLQALGTIHSGMEFHAAVMSRDTEQAPEKVGVPHADES